MRPARTTRAQAVGWLAAVTLVAARVVEVTRSSVYGDDLTVFWTAGHRAVHGTDPWVVRGFDYLPASLAIFAPLGAMPYDAARVLWLVVGIGALVGSAVWIACRTGLPVPYVVIGVFLAFPTVSALEFANATVLELPIVVALTAAVAGERWGRAAVLLTVGIVVKPLLLPCLLVLVSRRKPRHLATVVAALVVVDAAALAAVGHAGAYVRQLRASLTTAGDDPHSADLGALVARHEIPLTVAVAGGVLVAAAAILVVLRTDRAEALVATPLLAAFLVGSVCWAHYPLLLLPLAAALVADRRVGAAAALALLASPEVVHGALLTAVPPAPLFGLITLALLVLLADATAECGWVVRARVGVAR